MPTKRRSRRRPREAGVSAGVLAYLLCEPHAEAYRENNFWDFWYLDYPGVCRHAHELWLKARAVVVPEWIEHHPGTRPPYWWHYDAPEPRRRIGGTGLTPWDAGLAYKPMFERGIPELWHTVDENDLPSFESEATYLARLGLLSPIEKRLLSSDAFEPETIQLPASEELTNLYGRTPSRSDTRNC